jgi:AAA+ superfamily predicted ATPase
MAEKKSVPAVPVITSSDFMDRVRGSSPLQWIKTFEDGRVFKAYVTELLTTKIINPETKKEEKYHAYVWDVADGLRKLDFANGEVTISEPMDKADTPQNKRTAGEPYAPLDWFAKEPNLENTVLFLQGYHKYLVKDFAQSDVLIQKLRNHANALKSPSKNLCKIIAIVSPVVDIPIELSKEVHVVDFKIPDRNALKGILRKVSVDAGKPYPEDREEALVDSALGMIDQQAEEAFTISVIRHKEFDPIFIRNEKANAVKQSNIIEIVDTTGLSLDDIGGNEILKQWFVQRKNCTTAAARSYGIQQPKGLLIVGTSGCGKSLTAKCAPVAWNRPLLRFDLGKVFGSLLGESEQNMQSALDTADACSPCFLWVDEIEKSASGNKGGGSGQEGHEVTRKVFQQLLTWMNEKKTDVFLIATANSVESLPPELLRAGRMDAIFFVDLPDHIQREEIIRIHLRRSGQNPKGFDAEMAEMIRITEQFSGAEIEQWVKEALIHAFNAGKPRPVMEDFVAAKEEITPIALLMPTEIAATRAWAKARKAKVASITHEVVTSAPAQGRKVNIAIPGSDGAPTGLN